MIIKDTRNKRVWLVYYSNAQFISVYDINNRLIVAMQGEESDEPLEKFDDLGPLEFIDWFYENELDLAFAPLENDTYKRLLIDEIIDPSELYYEYYVTCNDTFMSFWGLSKDKVNKVVIGCRNREECEKIYNNMKNRSEMKYVYKRLTKPYYDDSVYYVSWKDSIQFT